MLAKNSVGLGLRFPHFEKIISFKPRTPWFEVIADDFLPFEKYPEAFQKRLQRIKLFQFVLRRRYDTMKE